MSKINKFTTSEVPGDLNSETIPPLGLAFDDAGTIFFANGSARAYRTIGSGVMYGYGSDASGQTGKNTIKLIPDYGSFLASTDQHIVVDPVGDNRVHIRSGSTPEGSSSDLYLGGTSNYFKISDSNKTAELKLTGNNSVLSWQFNGDGTTVLPLKISVGSRLPITFTANLNSNTFYPTTSNYLFGNGDSWSYDITFAVDGNGTVTTVFNNTPKLTSIGYSVGDTFRFTEQHHGIPNFDFFISILTITESFDLTSYAVELSLSNPPLLDAALSTTGPLKLMAGTSAYRFGSNSSLTLPNNSTISEHIGTDGTNTTYDLELVPGTVSSNQKILVRKKSNQSNIVYLAQGDSSEIDLYIGDDNQNIQILVDGNIEVAAYQRETSGLSYSWKFRNDGSFSSKQGEIYLKQPTPLDSNAGLFTIGTVPLLVSSEESVLISANLVQSWNFEKTGNLTLSSAGIVRSNTGSDINFYSGNKFNIIAGQMPSGEESQGGNVSITAGNGSNTIEGFVLSAGYGGDIKIVGGNAGLVTDDPALGNFGGKVEVKGGTGSGSNAGGDVTIKGGTGFSAGLVKIGENSQWIFDENSDSLTIPGSIIADTVENNGKLEWKANSSINGLGKTILELHPDVTVSGNDQFVVIDTKDTDVVQIRSGGSDANLIIGGDNNLVKLDEQSGVFIEHSTSASSELTFQDTTDFTDGKWLVDDGLNFIEYVTLDADMIAAATNFGIDSRDVIKVNGSAEELPLTGSFLSLGSNTYRIGVGQSPGVNPTTLTDITFVIFTKKITSATLSSDEFTITSAGNINLRTSGTQYIWRFGTDGSMTTPGLLKTGNIQVGRNIYGSAIGGISNAIQLRPNIDIDKRFLFTVDSSGGNYLRSGMEMPMAEVNKAVTLGFPHDNSTAGYIFNQGTDTNGTEWNDALVIFQNGGNVKIGTITNSNGTKIWEFNQTGNLTLPQTNMNASPAPVSLPGITFTDGTRQTTAFTGAAATVDITNTNGLTTTYYPTFVESRTNGQYMRADVDFTYHSDSNTLTVPKIAGMLQGNVNHAGGYINFTGSPSPVSTGITFADGTSQTTAWTRSAAQVQSSPPTSPVTGQLYYDTDDGKTYIWTGSAWVDASPSGSAAPTWQEVTLTGGSGAGALYLTSSSPEYTYVVTSNESRNIRLPSSVGLVLGRRFVIRNSGNAGLPIQTSTGTAFNLSIYQNQTVTAIAANVAVDGTASWMLEITGSSLTGVGSHVMAFSPTITTPTMSGATKMAGVHEKFSSFASLSGVVSLDASTSQIFYITTPGDNWTPNLLNLNLTSTYATAVTFVISQGATAYYPNALQIGGVAQTINWQGNQTPTPTANRVDTVTFSIFNNSGTYTVLGQMTGF